MLFPYTLINVIKRIKSQAMRISKGKGYLVQPNLFQQNGSIFLIILHEESLFNVYRG